MRRHLSVTVPMILLIYATLACIPPQDCSGSDFSVRGQVVDETGQPLPGAAIRAYGDKCYEAEAFDFAVASDENGSFETDEVFRFACCDFNVEVSAEVSSQ